MNIRFQKLLDWYLCGDNGKIGKVVDAFIEDGNWNIRYLVVAIPEKLQQRRVIVSPSAISGYDQKMSRLISSLGTDEILQSPRVDWAAPISRQYEQALVEHFGWPLYWLGRTVMSPQRMSDLTDDDATFFVQEDNQSTLRSLKEVCGYTVVSRNGVAGCMSDVVIDADSWQVEFALSEPNSWLARASCMFPTCRIQQVDWSSRAIMVNLEKTELVADKSRELPETFGLPKLNLPQTPMRSSNI